MINVRHETTIRLYKMLFFKKNVGRIGEDLTVKHLKTLGFSILERNFLKPFGEIDIIAKKGSSIHFVEVKTVTVSDDVSRGTDVYEPEDNVHSWKLTRLNKTIQSYLLEKGIDEDKNDYQLDLITVYLDKGQKLVKIEYLDNVF